MRGWLEAQDLLDRVRKELPAIHQLPPLVGCSPSTLPIQPMRRFVVSLPAVARMLTKIRISSRVRLRTSPEVLELDAQ